MANLDIKVQLQAERALLGSAICRSVDSRDAAAFFAGVVDAAWFVSPPHVAIANSIKYCIERGMSPDAKTLEIVVRSSGNPCETIASDIARCIDSSPGESVTAIEHYAAIVRDSHCARLIRDRCVEVANQADSFMPGSLGIIEANAMGLCNGISYNGQSFFQMSDIDEGMANPNSVKSYFEIINRPQITACGGYPSGEFSFVMSPRGNGKSAVLIREAIHAAVALRKRVVYVTLEMSKEQVKARAMKQMTGFTNIPYRDDYRREYNARRAELSSSDLVIMHCIGEMLVWERFRAEITRYAKTHGIDFLVIDYIQRFKSARFSEQKSSSRTEDLDYIADDLKSLSAELRIPTLTAAQPTQHMAADSAAEFTTKHAKAIEEHAALGINILKDKDGTVEAIISKNRYGPSYIRLPIIWDEQHAEFRQAATP